MAVSRDRRNGYWRYRKVVQLPDGRKVRITGTPSLNTKQAAEAAERAHIIRTLDPRAEKKEVPKFKAFVEDRWWPTYPAAAGNRFATRYEKESHLRVHLVPALGSLPLDKIRGEVISRFLAALRGKGLSEKSVKNVQATLRRILASAVEWGDLETIPPMPKVKVPQPKWDYLTAEETAAVISAARTNEERAILVFALHTGARAGEQIAVEWGDVDWTNHLLVFRRSSTRGQVGPTKSGRERRVPMTPTLERALRQIRHLRGPLVFSDADGRALRLDQLHERLWGACRRAGLRKIRWHDLRHSFASQLASRGVPLRQVQEWLGHSTITMTMRYAHLAPGGGAELIRALEAPAVATAWQREGG
jgi:integrase